VPASSNSFWMRSSSLPTRAFERCMRSIGAYQQGLSHNVTAEPQLQAFIVIVMTESVAIVDMYGQNARVAHSAPDEIILKHDFKVAQMPTAVGCGLHHRLPEVFI